MITQLTKWGNSQGIRINKETLRSLNFNSEDIEEQRVKFEMKIEDGRIILNPVKKITKLDRLFEDFKDDPKDFKVSIDWGNPVGKEV